MTPDQARALLADTTPGPWEWCEGKDQNGEFVALCGPDGADALRTWDGDLYASGVHGTNVNKALASAAPEMAAMIAGMREEWAREARIMGSTEWHNLGWCRSRAEAELTDWSYFLPRGATVEYRLARRYVTEPEEA